MFTKFFLNKMDKKSQQKHTSTTATMGVGSAEGGGGAEALGSGQGTGAGSSSEAVTGVAAKLQQHVQAAGAVMAAGLGLKSTMTTTSKAGGGGATGGNASNSSSKTNAYRSRKNGFNVMANKQTGDAANSASRASNMHPVISNTGTLTSMVSATSRNALSERRALSQISNSAAASGISVLTQMQKHSTSSTATSIANPNSNNPNASSKTNTNNNNNNSNQLTDKIMRMSRRAAMKELTAMHAKTIASRDKNEEAIRELETRIPELGKIFDISGRIGSGTFSTVLLATLKRERDLPELERRKFAIKHHNPTNHPDRIIRELECMFKMGGTQNVIGIHCCIRYHDSIAFIMPYMSHDRFHDIFRLMTVAEAKDYIRQLLIALRHVHRFSVIHRDVKPSNILYNRRTRQFLLCDFGLAQRLADDGSILQMSDVTSTTKENSVPTFDSLMQHPISNKEIRAVGGGGVDELSPNDGIGAITQALANTDIVSKPLSKIPAPPLPMPMQQPYSVHNSVLTKKDLVAQKADTNRLLNRLRQLSPNIDINNYVVTTNAGKKDVHASRAGTPGYRPPEVLMRYPYQTTAVDIWAAGVIMLSIMSSMHPFFKAPNDCAALSEIINLFGDLPVRKTAFMLDRLVMLTQKMAPLDLRRVCMRFRHSDAFTAPEVLRRYKRADGTCELCHNCEQHTYNCLCRNTSYKIETYDHLDIFPASAYDLLNRLLEVNPVKRITAEEALNHPFFADQREQQLTNCVKSHNCIKEMGTLKPYLVSKTTAGTTATTVSK